MVGWYPTLYRSPGLTTTTAAPGTQDKVEGLASALASITAAGASACCPWLRLARRLRPPPAAGVRAAPGAGCARGARAARAAGARVRCWPLPETRAVRWLLPEAAVLRRSSGTAQTQMTWLICTPSLLLPAEHRYPAGSRSRVTRTLSRVMHGW